MKNIFILLSVALIAMACEKEVKFKAEEIEPRIVVNSLFSIGDTIWINLSESRTTLYQESLPVLTNATAKLLDENATEIGTFTHAAKGNYYCSDVSLLAGKRYGLTVKASNFSSVKAATEIPSPIELITIDTNTINDHLNFNISFMDNSSEENYYSISLVYKALIDDGIGGEYTYSHTVFSTKELFVKNGSTDIDGKKYAYEFLFDDKTLNGQLINFKATNDNNDIGETTDEFYSVKISSLSKEAYDYKFSLSNYLEAKDSPFSEPVQVYSTIENGFGIFGGLTIYSDTIWVD